MRIKKVYLTIDDSPSIHMDKKVLFLKNNNIPAIFYARGECIEKYSEQVVHAIRNGFLIGNHSYSHPYFSEIPLEQCVDEIIKTEALIDQCYKTALIKRPYKVIRLPFADRGAGAKAAIATNQVASKKTNKIQNFLQRNNFVKVVFKKQTDRNIDSFWDWDTEDYKGKHIADECLYVEKLKKFYDACTSEESVLLLHDFDHNHHLFDITMKFLIERNVEFLRYQINEGSL